MANGVASGAYADCASWTPARAWRGRSNDHVAAVGSSCHWVGRWLKNWYETPGALTPTSDAPRAHWPAGGAGPPPADGHDQPPPPPPPPLLGSASIHAASRSAARSAEPPYDVTAGHVPSAVVSLIK